MNKKELIDKINQNLSNIIKKDTISNHNSMLNKELHYLFIETLLVKLRSFNTFRMYKYVTILGFTSNMDILIEENYNTKTKKIDELHFYILKILDIKLEEILSISS